MYEWVVNLDLQVIKDISKGVAFVTLLAIAICWILELNDKES